MGTISDKKRILKVQEIGMAGPVLLTHCEEYDELLNTLSTTSNLLTRRQRKPSPSQDDELTVVASCRHSFYSKYLVIHIFEARVSRTGPAIPIS